MFDWLLHHRQRIGFLEDVFDVPHLIGDLVILLDDNEKVVHRHASRL
jgi:hypothetical protein